jgi:GDPmannose 4,6-dehydratase
MRRALITGITGQDGSYLAELLLGKGYVVHGLVRPVGATSLERIRHLLEPPNRALPRIQVHAANLHDGEQLLALMLETQPDEIYHLAAQSQVSLSFAQPLATAEVTGLATLRMLEAMRRYRETTGRQPRFVQASSSEQFGQVRETPQRETTPFYPRSPYGVAKVFAHFTTVNYRESWGLHASCAILFNHESPRRPASFVTRKITRAAARISLGLENQLALGNLEAVRDWGFAGDYVEALWRMLQQEQPGDFVIATGVCHSVRDFCQEAFAAVGLDYEPYVVVDPRFFRPAEVERVVGDASKARAILGWQPRVSFRELVRMMVAADRAAAEQELAGQRAAA